MLEGEISVVTAEGTLPFSAGDLFLISPFQRHEITAREPALILSLQISPAFFRAYYPRIDEVFWNRTDLRKELSLCAGIRFRLMETARIYFGELPQKELRCAAEINRLFYELVTSELVRFVSEKEKENSVARGQRARRIMKYIDAHYTEKILLSDIARQEGMNLHYLSHFFRDSFGLSFQEYVTRSRCELARQQLLLTERSLLDISEACGFSDSRYFNRSFARQYGCLPKTYRKQLGLQPVETREKSVRTAQSVLPFEECGEKLEGYLSVFAEKS